jgi:hypothetical protein
MTRGVKESLLNITFLRRAWAKYRANELEDRYQRWQSNYGRLAERQGLFYSKEWLQRELDNRLTRLNVRRKKPGQIHTGIFIRTSNWGIGMAYELQALGPISIFDWDSDGFSGLGPKHKKKLVTVNKRILDFVIVEHLKRPFDWLLMTGSGNMLLRSTVQQIREQLGIPIVNQWLDCKQNFESGMGPYGQDRGMKDISQEFDVMWTSSRSMCEPYMAIGARPLYLPEGFSPRLTPRLICPKRFEVGFMGARYGLRQDYIDALRCAGFQVETHGPGWKCGEVPLQQMGRFFGECKVNLGMGGVGYSMELTTLKGRDFEIPGAGGAYLTTYNPDLAEFFHIGHEILCYHSIDDMIEQARRLVRDDSFQEELAARAYKRSMREHRWLHRFMKILGFIGILPQTQEDNVNPSK